MRAALLAVALAILAGCAQIDWLEWQVVDHGNMCAGPDAEIVIVHESPAQLLISRAESYPPPLGVVGAFTRWQIGCICEVHLPPPDSPDYEEFKLHEFRHCHEGHFHDRYPPFHDL